MASAMSPRLSRNSTSSSPMCLSSVTTSSNSWRLPVHSTGSNLPDSSRQVPPKPEIGLPLWLLAELTYRCPLQCPYCSNPLDFAEQGQELSTEQKISDFKKAGLDHIQISFQASDEQVNNLLAGSKKAFAQKLEMARAVKAHGYPMVLNFFTHRHNIDK